MIANVNKILWTKETVHLLLLGSFTVVMLLAMLTHDSSFVESSRCEQRRDRRRIHFLKVIDSVVRATVNTHKSTFQRVVLQFKRYCWREIQEGKTKDAATGRGGQERVGREIEQGKKRNTQKGHVVLR